MQIHNNVVISFTNKCTANCDICCMNSSINNNERLSNEIVISAIDETADMGIKVLLFSGGEPLLYYDDLLMFLSRSKKHNMIVSLNTNAYWCNNYDDAKEKMLKLRRNGLANIITSLDIFHNKFISVNNIKIFLKAAKDTGLRPILNLCGGYDQADQGIIELLKEVGSLLYNVDLRFFPVSFVGRAAQNLDNHKLKYTYRIDDIRCDAYQTIHILSNGNVCACCCELNKEEPFVLGNLYDNSLSSIVNSYRKCVPYNLVLKKGFRWIAERVKSIIPDLLEIEYNNPCEFCERVFCGKYATETISVLNNENYKE